MPLMPAPPSVSAPLRRTDLLFFRNDAFSVNRCGSGTIDRVSTVPTGFGVPVFGTYGVKSARHTYWPGVVGFPKTLLNAIVASSTFAPNAAPPCDCGISGDARQICSLYDANTLSAPAAASTNTGILSGVPAACSARTQNAPCVAVPVHATDAC